MKTALIIDGVYSSALRDKYGSGKDDDLERLAQLAGSSNQPAAARYFLTSILPENETSFLTFKKSLEGKLGYQVIYLIAPGQREGSPSQRWTKVNALAIIGYVICRSVLEGANRLVIYSGNRNLVPVLREVRRDRPLTKIVILAHSFSLSRSLASEADEVWLLDEQSPWAGPKIEHVTQTNIWRNIHRIKESAL